MSPAAAALRTPPDMGWQEWYAREWAGTKQGRHKLFAGPTQSGKTVLCREVSRLQSYTVVFGTKAVDPSLDAYVNEGYERIDHWSITKRDMRNQPSGTARFILWPKIKKREDLRRFRGVYAKCMEDVFIEGRWCVVIDEGLWVCSKDGLNLGQLVSDLAYGSASNKVSMHLLVQRISNVPPVTWTSASDAYLFHSGRTDDQRELASLGVYQPREVAQAIQRLEGHKFLHLPCRGGAEWSVSEVDPAVAAHGGRG